MRTLSLKNTSTSLTMATPTMVLYPHQLCRSFHGKLFLFIIDAHSKWLDIYITNLCNTQSMVGELCVTFANHGLLEMVVSDNGPAFVSKLAWHINMKRGI